MGEGSKFVCVTFIASLALFFGLLFGLVYPEIKRSYYLPTYCRSTNATIIPSYCCSTACSSCSTAAPAAPSCGVLIEQIQNINPLKDPTPNARSGAACHSGYKCCHRGCSTCCTGSGSDRKCAECNCYCSSSTDRLSCTMNCGVCYTVRLHAEYKILNGVISSVISQPFGSDINAAQKFLEEHSDFNDEYQCFYDLNDPKTVVLDISFTRWRMAIFAVFGIVPLYVHLVILNWYLFANCKIPHVAAGLILTWLGFVPFIILGSVFWGAGIEGCLFAAITLLIMGMASSGCLVCIDKRKNASQRVCSVQ